MPIQHSERLTQAREELDQALDDAIGNDEGEQEDNDDMECDYAGDMTSMNEDFTMVSVETLQSMKADTSMLSTRHDVGDKSGLSVSYLPSSPPQTRSEQANVVYPNLAAETTRVEISPRRGDDDMSWKPKKAATSSPNPRAPTEQRLDSEPSEWRREREAVSRQINDANTSKVIVIEDTEMPSNIMSEDSEGSVEEPEDIWQEEASRSFEEEIGKDQQAEKTTMPMKASHPKTGNELLLADHPLKPRRAKIPRTWRRSSGADFSYADSPAHVEPLLVSRKRSGGSTDGESRASSGVLTPPSTDDEVREHRSGQEDAEESSDISLTQPRPLASHLQGNVAADGEATDPRTNEVVSPLSDSESSMGSPDGEDTGLFWQSNLPHVYRRPTQRPRPQRQRAMDLSELLGLDKSSPAKKAASSANVSGSVLATEQKRSSPLRTRAAEAPPREQAGKAKVVSSPLRKSLLRSSRMQASASGASSSSAGLSSRMGSDAYEIDEQHDQSSRREQTGPVDVAGDESFASKASDQRQLLTEMADVQFGALRHRGTDLPSVDRPARDAMLSDDDTPYNASPGGKTLNDDEETGSDDEQEAELDRQAASSEEVYDEPSRSYEEHLNVESPQKIRVKFNDSSRCDGSSLLAPKREYAPLFAGEPGQQTHEQSSDPSSPRTITLVSKKSSTQSQQAQPGIFSRLTTNFWSAVVRPSGPSEILPPIPTTLEEQQTFPKELRARLRSRYGVLSASHPWTMAHMRTLHRMLNSCTSGKSDSIILMTPSPSSGLSKRYVGKQQVSIAGYRFVFEEQHALVVEAFMQVLVPAHIVEAMAVGEVEMLGDAIAVSYRGRLVDGRHGSDRVWSRALGVRKPGTAIEVDFVVKALGDVVYSNVQTAAKEARAANERLI